MSDFNSSLPMRTEAAGDVQVKVVDGLVTTQVLAINADGSVNMTDNGTSLTVDANNLDIRDLVFATDKVDVSDSVIALDAPTLAALESITVQNGAGASAVNIQDGGNSITVDAVDLDIRDLVAATDSVAAHLKDATGTAFSVANPLPVLITSSQPGTEINDYNTAAAVAASATSNHDYTVTALTTLLLSQIEASASGKMKIEVSVETGVGTGTFTSKFVQFNSTANPNMHIELTQKITVAAGVKVRVARTNLDNQAQDVYSTICGTES